jgi:hypothetical protein
MSIRMSSDEKYRHLREQMDEAARTVANWPAWMHERVERERQWAKQRHALETQQAVAPEQASR